MMTTKILWLYELAVPLDQLNPRGIGVLPLCEQMVIALTKVVT